MRRTLVLFLILLLTPYIVVAQSVSTTSGGVELDSHTQWSEVAPTLRQLNKATYLELQDDTTTNSFVWEFSTGRFRFLARATDDQFIGLLNKVAVIDCSTPEINVSQNFDTNHGNFTIAIKARVCVDTGTVVIFENGKYFTITDTKSSGIVIPPVVVKPPSSPTYCAYSGTKGTIGWYFFLWDFADGNVQFALARRTDSGKTLKTVYEIYYTGKTKVYTVGDIITVNISLEFPDYKDLAGLVIQKGSLFGAFQFNGKTNTGSGVFFTTNGRKITITDANILNNKGCTL